VLLVGLPVQVGVDRDEHQGQGAGDLQLYRG
jgi:hypothetical protein